MKRLILLAILACIAPVAARAQSPRTGEAAPLTAEELHLVRCAAATVPGVPAIHARGGAPLLVVNGQAAGRLTRPTGACPADERLPRGASELRFIRGFAAREMFGDGARDGALLLDLPPARRTP